MTLTIAIERPPVKKTVDRQALANELSELEASRAAELPKLQQAIASTAKNVQKLREPFLEAKRLNDATRGDLTRYEIDGGRVERIRNLICHSADPAISDVVAKIDARLDTLRGVGIQISSVQRGENEVVSSNSAEVHDEMAKLQQARHQCEALKLQVNIDAEAELGKILADLENGK